MQLTLQVTAGPHAGRKVYIKSGQIVRIGRTEWADVSFPGDAELADVHFAVQCQLAGARVRKLVLDRALAVNSQDVMDAVLQAGDTIQAGQTAFSVLFDGFGGAPRTGAAAAAAGTVAAGAAVAAAAAPSDAGPREPNAAEIAATLQMAEEHQQLAGQVASGPEFVALLAEKGHFPQAVRVQSHLLPRRLAVWWGLVCLRELAGAPLSNAEENARAAAEEWTVDPSESRRRRCEALAAKTKYDGPGSWLAMAAFWSGGSIVPPEVGDVPPDEKLTGQAVTSSLMIAAVMHEPTKAKVRYRAFLATAPDVASGKLPIPENK